ncbi:hypothetical protein Gotur_013852 [Gossypium turneri]
MLYKKKSFNDALLYSVENIKLIYR